MIGKVKQWLGIEGVKLELLIPEGQTLAKGSISGTMRFQSMNPQTVTGIRVVLIERYSRGRKEELRIDEAGKFQGLGSRWLCFFSDER